MKSNFIKALGAIGLSYGLYGCDSKSMVNELEVNRSTNGPTVTITTTPLKGEFSGQAEAHILIYHGENTNGEDLKCVAFAQQVGNGGFGGESCNWAAPK